MPFVIDWTPVEALGSLAMQAGKAQGTTAGRSQFIARQHDIDLQTADINQRNRELAYQQTWAPINQKRQAAIDRQYQADQFQQQLAIENVRAAHDFDRQAYSIDAQAQRAEQSQQAAEERQFEGYQKRYEAEYDYDRRQAQDEESSMVEAMRAAGRPLEEIETAVIQSRQRRASGGGRATAGSVTGTEAGMKRPTGELRSLGFDLARTGNLQAWADPVVRRTASRNNATFEQAIGELSGGAFEYFVNEAVPLEQVQQVASDPSAPTWARSQALRAIAVRGDVRFGANQARPGGVQQMSTEELYGVFQ